MKRFDLDFPCTADFSKMRSVPGGRFCDNCNELVLNLSEMSEPEAQALLSRKTENRVCLRYVYDAHDERILFGRAAQKGFIVPERDITTRLRAKLALAAAIAGPLLVEACGGNNPYANVSDAGIDANADSGDESTE